MLDGRGEREAAPAPADDPVADPGRALRAQNAASAAFTQSATIVACILILSINQHEIMASLMFRYLGNKVKFRETCNNTNTS